MADGPGAPTSKIRIKIGQVEVEYEGAHDFLKEDLPALLATVVELRQRAGDDKDDAEDDVVDHPDDKKKKKKGAGSVTGTVGAIAAKLNVNSGPDLIIAAAAKLSLVDEQEKFGRTFLAR